MAIFLGVPSLRLFPGCRLRLWRAPAAIGAGRLDGTRFRDGGRVCRNVPRGSHRGNEYANLVDVTAKNGKHPATSLGRTMQRDRQAHGWTLRELSTRTKAHIGTLSQVENGIRPMTENLAM